jgi:hypothetical protein
MPYAKGNDRAAKSKAEKRQQLFFFAVFHPRKGKIPQGNAELSRGFLVTRHAFL